MKPFTLNAHTLQKSGGGWSWGIAQYLFYLHYKIRNDNQCQKGGGPAPPPPNSGSTYLMLRGTISSDLKIVEKWLNLRYKRNLLKNGVTARLHIQTY